MEYNVFVHDVNLLKISIFEIIIDKLMLIKFVMKIMLKHVLNVNNKNYILNFINV